MSSMDRYVTRSKRAATSLQKAKSAPSPAVARTTFPQTAKRAHHTPDVTPTSLRTKRPLPSTTSPSSARKRPSPDTKRQRVDSSSSSPLRPSRLHAQEILLHSTAANATEQARNAFDAARSRTLLLDPLIDARSQATKASPVRGQPHLVKLQNNQPPVLSSHKHISPNNTDNLDKRQRLKPGLPGSHLGRRLTFDDDDLDADADDNPPPSDSHGDIDDDQDDPCDNDTDDHDFLVLDQPKTVDLFGFAERRDAAKRLLHKGVREHLPRPRTTLDQAKALVAQSKRRAAVSSSSSSTDLSSTLTPAHQRALAVFDKCLAAANVLRARKSTAPISMPRKDADELAMIRRALGADILLHLVPNTPAQNKLLRTKLAKRLSTGYVEPAPSEKTIVVPRPQTSTTTTTITSTAAAEALLRPKPLSIVKDRPTPDDIKSTLDVSNMTPLELLRAVKKLQGRDETPTPSPTVSSTTTSTSTTTSPSPSQTLTPQTRRELKVAVFGKRRALPLSTLSTLTRRYRDLFNLALAEGIIQKVKYTRGPMWKWIPDDT